MFLFLPISDENPTSKKPLLTWSLIALNFLVFFYQLSLSGSANQMLINEFGVKPSVFFEMRDFHTIITSAFMHAGWIMFIGPDHARPPSGPGRGGPHQTDLASAACWGLALGSGAGHISQSKLLQCAPSGVSYSRSTYSLSFCFNVQGVRRACHP